MVYTIVVHLQAKVGKESKLAHGGLLPLLNLFCRDLGIEIRYSAKLKEASEVYKKDTETIDWHVMQDPADPTKFCIVERYEHESSQKYHLENPYWATFDPYVMPLLQKDMLLTRWEEM